MAKEGASVAVAGEKLEPLQETVALLKQDAISNGHTASVFRAYKMDVSSSEEVKSTVDCLGEDFRQPVSAVVNNAGIVRESFLLDITEQKFDRVINVNLKVTISNHGDKLLTL